MGFIGKLGIVLIFFGFLSVGVAELYAGTGMIGSQGSAVRIPVVLLSGAGWIAVGIGVSLSFAELYSPESEENRQGPPIGTKKAGYECSACGADVTADAIFCSRCGQKLDEEQTAGP